MRLIINTNYTTSYKNGKDYIYNHCSILLFLSDYRL